MWSDTTITKLELMNHSAFQESFADRNNHWTLGKETQREKIPPGNNTERKTHKTFFNKTIWGSLCL